MKSMLMRATHHCNLVGERVVAGLLPLGDVVGPAVPDALASGNPYRGGWGG